MNTDGPIQIESADSVSDALKRAGFRISPWGHPVRELDHPFSLLQDMESTFKLIPFQNAAWKFLERGKDKMLEAPAILRPLPEGSSLRTETSIYTTDGFSFDPVNNPYDRFLDQYRNDVDSLSQEFTQLFGSIDEVESLFSNVMDLKGTDRYLAQQLVSELSIANKFTIQRLTQDYWYAGSFTPPDIRMDATELNSLRNFISQCLQSPNASKWFKRSFFFDDNELADPTDTNPGSPTFTAGAVFRMINAELFGGVESLITAKPDDFSVIPETYMSVPTAYNDRIGMIASLMDVPAASVIGCGCNKRMGPSRKWSPILVNTGSDVVAYVEVQNLTRNRRVFMVPNHYNLLTGPAVQSMVALRHIIPGCYFDEDFRSHIDSWKKNALARGEMYFIESDFSSMDQNFSGPLRSQLISLFQERCPTDMSWRFKLLDSHRFMPYIIPDPLDLDSGSYAGLVASPKKSGAGLFSGLKATSALDSIGAIAYLNAMMSRLMPSQWLGRLRNPGSSGLFVGNQGDDIILGFQKSDWDRLKHRLRSHTGIFDYFTKGASAFGWPAKLIPGDTFLMKHVYSPSSQAPVLARIIQQTFSNEHIRNDDNLVTLGLLARTQNSHEMLFNDFVSSNQTDPRLKKLYLRFIDFYKSTMLKHSVVSKLSNVIMSKDNTLRIKGIEAISSLINSELEKWLASARNGLTSQNMRNTNPLVSLIISDRFSSSTQELLSLLKLDSKIEATLNNVDSLEKMLYQRCITALRGQVPTREKISSLLSEYYKLIGR